MRQIKYCLLAKSIPEWSKRDKMLYTCSIGYSPELGLIRVYPLPIKGMEKWGIYNLPLEKNKRDTRVESWKLASYSRKEEWIGIGKDVKFLGYANKYKIYPLLMSYLFNSIGELNKLKVSIGIVKVDDFNIYWTENERYINTRQFGLFEDVELANFTKYTKETKLKESRCAFIDADGRHDLQFNEWQVYEYQRKFKADKDAFRHLRKTQNDYLLLGNLHSHRNTWIVLSKFNYCGQLSFCL